MSSADCLPGTRAETRAIPSEPPCFTRLVIWVWTNSSVWLWGLSTLFPLPFQPHPFLLPCVLHVPSPFAALRVALYPFRSPYLRAFLGLFCLRSLSSYISPSLFLCRPRPPPSAQAGCWCGGFCFTCSLSLARGPRFSAVLPLAGDCVAASRGCLARLWRLTSLPLLRWATFLSAGPCIRSVVVALSCASFCLFSWLISSGALPLLLASTAGRGGGGVVLPGALSSPHMLTAL